MTVTNGEEEVQIYKGFAAITYSWYLIDILKLMSYVKRKNHENSCKCELLYLVWKAIHHIFSELPNAPRGRAIENPPLSQVPLQDRVSEEGPN